MQIEIHAQGQQLSPGLREHIESSLAQAFQRPFGRTRSVRVFLWDTNGPRGGVDQGVRLIVELANGSEVLVREVAENSFVALAKATERARHAARNAFQRQRTRRRRGGSRITASEQTDPIVSPANSVSAVLLAES